MKIIACVKQVPDTTEVKLDPVTGTLIRDGVPSIMNPDDRAGLEIALKLKDELGAEVTVVSMGPAQADAVLREALAMGADNAVLVSDRAFGGADTLATSTTLAAVIKKLGFDLIVAGRQAIDGDTAQVGPQIAEHLHITNVSYAESVEYVGNSLIVKRQYEDRTHVVKAELPCLVTVLSGISAARYMTPGGIRRAYNEKNIQLITRADLDVRDEDIGHAGSPTRVVQSFPKKLKANGEKFENLDAEQAADCIFAKLHEKHVI